MSQAPRVLGVSNGPQRIQCPAGSQKPVSAVLAGVKPAYAADLNMNHVTPTVNPPPTQQKHGVQPSQPKTKAAKVNPEPARNATDQSKKEPSQSNHYHFNQAYNYLDLLSCFGVLLIVVLFVFSFL